MLGLLEITQNMDRSLTFLSGGIVSMDIMLVSVTERTKEIGIRKAIGAPPAAILVHFLVEAVVLGLAGGALGISQGFAVAKGVNRVAGCSRCTGRGGSPDMTGSRYTPRHKAGSRMAAAACSSSIECAIPYYRNSSEDVTRRFAVVTGTEGRRVRLSVDVNPELRRHLQVVASQRDQSVSQFVEAALVEAVAGAAGPAPVLPRRTQSRSLGAGEDAELAASDSKAWLRAHWTDH